MKVANESNNGLVKISIPSLSGPMTVAGAITRIKGDLVEVKTQAHGYFWVNKNEIKH